jgi:hypothetical protein
VSGRVSDIYGEEGRGISPTLESQLRSASPSVPFVPVLPSQASRHIGAPREGGRAPEGVRDPRDAVPPEGVQDPRDAVPPEGVRDPREGVPPEGVRDPREGVPPEGVRDPREGARSPEGASYYPRSETASDVLPIPEPQTRGHIRPGSETPPSETYEVPRSPTISGEEPRDGLTPPGARIPGVSRAATTRTIPRTGPRYPSGPGDLGYDDAERARHERFGEIERQLADITQDATEAEMRRDHEFQEREADRDRQFGQNEFRREGDARNLMDEMTSTRAQGQPPAGFPGAPATDTEAPLPVPGPRFGGPTSSELGVPEQAESVIASIRRASTESAARHADDIRDIVHGEREEMARQLQLEREEARAAREVLEQQVLAERARANEECEARVRELEEELSRVRAQLDHEKQQRDHDEELRREEDARKDGERDDEMRQQLNDITDLLMAQREQFARKKETMEEHWERKQEWREEDGGRWDELYRMVQGIIDNCAEAKEKCEEERRAAAEKPCE